MDAYRAFYNRSSLQDYENKRYGKPSYEINTGAEAVVLANNTQAAMPPPGYVQASAPPTQQNSPPAYPNPPTGTVYQNPPTVNQSAPVVYATDPKSGGAAIPVTHLLPVRGFFEFFF